MKRAPCPLSPQKRTFASVNSMSALCQKRTSRCLHGDAPAEQEILRAAIGSKGHEVLTREPAPVLIGSRWLMRAGSGAG